MRQIRWTVGPVFVGLLVVACAAPTDPTGERAGPTTGFAPATADPLTLIGSWTITEAEEEEGAILRLATGDLTLFRRCGQVMGHWRATTDALFVAHTFSSDCGPDAIATPAWLRRVASFRQDGDARLLLDQQGETVARLRPVAQPTSGTRVNLNETAPPVVDEEARRTLAPASPVPGNLRPAVRSTLLGRWVPSDGQSNGIHEPFVEFAPDGEWHGSDGCNRSSGRWGTGPAGTLLATIGASTLIACSNSPHPEFAGRGTVGESAPGVVFPHIYGPIELEGVVAVAPLERGTDGKVALPL